MMALDVVGQVRAIVGQPLARGISVSCRIQHHLSLRRQTTTPLTRIAADRVRVVDLAGLGNILPSLLSGSTVGTVMVSH